MTGLFREEEEDLRGCLERSGRFGVERWRLGFLGLVGVGKVWGRY